MTGGGGSGNGDDDGETTSRGGNDAPSIAGLPFRQAMPSRPQYKTGPMKIVSSDVPHSATPFGDGGSPAAPASTGPSPVTPAIPGSGGKDRPLAIPAPHVLGARGQSGRPAIVAPVVPQTPPSRTPPPPPARVQSAPVHLEPGEWPSAAPQRAPEPVPVRDVPPPAWTQRSDWDARAASDAAAADPKAPPVVPPGATQAPGSPSSPVSPAVPAAVATAAAAAASALIDEEADAIRAPEGFVAPGMELVFHDEAFFSQIRMHFRLLVEDMEPDPNRSFAEDVAEVLHILATAARPQDPKVVARHAERRVGSGALPPLEVWDGTLALELDPVERLRLEVESARRILKPSPELTRVIDATQADLDATRGLSARRALIRSKELRDQTKWGLQTEEDHALDLFERRAYRSVEVFGGRHVRGVLKVRGGAAFCVYMAVSAANQLPLLPNVNVTAIAERRARQEQDAVSDVALHFRVLARHVG